MKNYYYYNILRKCTVQLLEYFNDIEIGRFDDEGELRKTIKVPLKFAPKEKAYMWLYNKDKKIITPQMAMHITAIEFDVNRQGSKTSNITFSENPSAYSLREYLNPIPYNITYELNILSSYMDDINQIVEQILPFFTPNAFLRIKIPQLDTSLDLKIVFTGSSPNLPLELDGSSYRILQWDMIFVLHGYLFQPLKITPTIKDIIENIYTDEEEFDDRSTTSEFTSAALGDITRFTQAINKDISTKEITYEMSRYDNT